MVDEDFVMGYAVGFNDGVGSGGGGSGGEYSDIVIYRQYDFGSSGYGIAIPDFTKGNRFILPYAMKVYQPPNTSDLSTWKYGPVYSWEVFPQAVCMTYNGQVKGMYTYGTYDTYFEEYTYINGVFRLDNEKLTPTLISAELYNTGGNINEKIEYKLSESDSVRTMDKGVLMVYPNINLVRMSELTGHGGDAFFRAWSIAYIKNGITGVCDPINPYAE